MVFGEKFALESRRGLYVGLRKFNTLIFPANIAYIVFSKCISPEYPHHSYPSPFPKEHLMGQTGFCCCCLFGPHLTAFEILVPRPGIKHTVCSRSSESAVGARSLNHRTTKETPGQMLSETHFRKCWVDNFMIVIVLYQIEFEVCYNIKGRMN